MRSNKPRTRTEARALCNDLYPDDSPTTFRRKESRDDDSVDRKTMQLCAQIRRALHGVIQLPGSTSLEGLHVEAVEPDPDASRLRVVISVPPSCAHPIPVIKQRLTDMAGYFRSEVATQIHRKRVPLLTFELIPREEET